MVAAILEAIQTGYFVFSEPNRKQFFSVNFCFVPNLKREIHKCPINGFIAFFSKKHRARFLKEFILTPPEVQNKNKPFNPVSSILSFSFQMKSIHWLKNQRAWKHGIVTEAKLPQSVVLRFGRAYFGCRWQGNLLQNAT